MDTTHNESEPTTDTSFASALMAKRNDPFTRAKLGSIDTSVAITKTDRPNSFSFRLAGPGTEVKLYFEDAQDLEDQVRALAESQDLSLQLAVIKAKYAEEKK